jgi:hypothetical protein
MVSTAAAHCVSTLKPGGRLPFTHVASVFHPHVNGGLPVARSAFQDYMGSRTRARLSFAVHVLQGCTGVPPFRALYGFGARPAASDLQSG